MKKVLLPCLSIILAILFLNSCTPAPWEEQGLLQFPDYSDYRGIYGGQQGEYDFGEILVSEHKAHVLRLKNPTSKPLVIDAITFDSKHFDFYNRQAPLFPMVLAPGEISDQLRIMFAPETNGLQTAKVTFFIKNRKSYISLSGIGLWEVILSINLGNLGKITSPKLVDDFETPQRFHTATGVVDLTTETYLLTKFSQWNILGTPKIPPEFHNGDLAAPDTRVTVFSHTAIEAVFEVPFVFFPVLGLHAPADEYTSLQAAINACEANDEKEGVVVYQGTHTVSDTVTLKPGVAVFGGYDNNFNNGGSLSREYQSEAERSDPIYMTVLNFTDDNRFIIPSTVSASGMLEGLTLSRSAASSSPVLDIQSSSSPVIRYNTVQAVGSGAAVRVGNASPAIRFNSIYGGNITAASDAKSKAVHLIRGSAYFEGNIIAAGTSNSADSRSYGIYAQTSAKPVLFKNDISGGRSVGNRAQSYGIYLDFECEPLIVGNTISGGRADGSNGISTGVYFINNGRATLRYNDISGGHGNAISRALYSAYGTNFYLRFNNIRNEGGASQYGLYLGANGRVRRLENNGFINVPILQYRFLQGDSIRNIDSLNNFYNVIDDEKHNLSSAIGFTIPEEAGQQEWNE